MFAKKPPRQEFAGLPRAEHGQETILLVEDEVNLRRLAHQYLAKQGYRFSKPKTAPPPSKSSPGIKAKSIFCSPTSSCPG
jgi:hypothetical protein